jgi:hypothetical protein
MFWTGEARTIAQSFRERLLRSDSSREGFICWHLGNCLTYYAPPRCRQCGSTKGMMPQAWYCLKCGEAARRAASPQPGNRSIYQVLHRRDESQPWTVQDAPRRRDG